MKTVSLVCLYIAFSCLMSGSLYALQAPILLEADVDSTSGSIHIFRAENEPDADSIILFYRVESSAFIKHKTFTSGGYVSFNYKEKYLYSKQLGFAAMFFNDNNEYSDTSNILTITAPVLDSIARPPLLTGVRYIDSSGYVRLSFKDSCNYEKSFMIFRRAIPGNFKVIRTIAISEDSAISIRDRSFNDSMVQPFAWYGYRIAMVTGKNETLYSRDSSIYTDFHNALSNSYTFDLRKLYPIKISDLYGSWTEIIGDSLFTVQQINSKNYVVILDISDESAPVYDTIFPFDKTPPQLAGTVIEPLCRLNIMSNRKKNLQFLRTGNYCFTIESRKIHQYSADGSTLIGEIPDDSVYNYFLGALPDSVFAVIGNGYKVRRIRYSGSGEMNVLDSVSVDLHSLYREVDFTGLNGDRFTFLHSGMEGARYDIIDYSIPDTPLHYYSDAEMSHYGHFITKPLDSISFVNVFKLKDSLYTIATYDNRSGHSPFQICWEGIIGGVRGSEIEDAAIDTVKKRLVLVTDYEIVIFKYAKGVVQAMDNAVARKRPSRSVLVNQRPDGVVFQFMTPAGVSTTLTCFDLLGRTAFALHRKSNEPRSIRIAGKLIPAGTYIYRVKTAGNETAGRFTVSR